MRGNLRVCPLILQTASLCGPARSLVKSIPCRRRAGRHTDRCPAGWSQRPPISLLRRPRIVGQDEIRIIYAAWHFLCDRNLVGCHRGNILRLCRQRCCEKQSHGCCDESRSSHGIHSGIFVMVTSRHLMQGISYLTQWYLTPRLCLVYAILRRLSAIGKIKVSVDSILDDQC